MYKKGVKNKKTRKIKWEFRMLVGDHDDYDTKDRTYSLGRIMREPSVTKVIAASIQQED